MTSRREMMAGEGELDRLRRQTLLYAEELRELYRRERERANELQAANEVLEALLARVQRADRARDELVTNFSHEFRAPLTIMLGWAETLKTRRQLTGELLVEAAEAIAAKGKALIELVDSLLRIVSLPSDDDDARRALVDVEALLKRASDEARRARRRVEVEVEPKGMVATLDERQLEEILAHLLSNAVKFSEQTTPIHLRAEIDAEGVTFAVVDRGVGVPPSARDAIFQSLARDDGTSTQAFGGLGTGLYICSRLISANGGRIWLEETPGGGATFRFTLPHRRDADVIVVSPAAS